MPDNDLRPPTPGLRSGRRSTRALASRILILDGAMGTMIQRHKLSRSRFPRRALQASSEGSAGQQRPADPDAARRHPRDPRAVPGGRRRHHRDQHLQQHDRRAGRLPARARGLRAESWRARGSPRQRADEWTKKTPDRPRFVAGSIGPTNRTLSISPEVNNPAFRADHASTSCASAYEEQVRGLIDGGSDLILLETIFDTLNAKAGIVAIENVFAEKGVRLPLMISFTITDKSGRTLSGQTLEAFYTSVRHAQPVQHRHQLRARRARHASVSRRPGAHRRVLRLELSQRGPAQRLRRSTTNCPPKPASSSRTSPPAASSTSSAAVAERRLTTSRPSRKRLMASPPRRGPRRRVTTRPRRVRGEPSPPRRDWNRWSSGPTRTSRWSESGRTSRARPGSRG